MSPIAQHIYGMFLVQLNAYPCTFTRCVCRFEPLVIFAGLCIRKDESMISPFG